MAIIFISEWGKKNLICPSKWTNVLLLVFFPHCCFALITNSGGKPGVYLENLLCTVIHSNTAVHHPSITRHSHEVLSTHSQNFTVQLHLQGSVLSICHCPGSLWEPPEQSCWNDSPRLNHNSRHPYSGKIIPDLRSLSGKSNLWSKHIRKAGVN